MAKLVSTVALIAVTVVPGVGAQGGEPTPIPGGGYVVRGRVWIDMDRDGRQDPEDGGIKQVGVHLINATSMAVADDATTGDDGTFRFSNVQKGTYMLRFDRPTIEGGPTMWEFTLQGAGNDDKLDSDVDAQGATPPFLVPAAGSPVNGNSTDAVMDAGNIRLSQPGSSGQCADAAPMSLGGTIWRDLDRSGHQNQTTRGINEPGIAGVEVHLWSESIENNGVTILHRADTGRSTVTDVTGRYLFRCLPEGVYYATIPALNGFSPTVPFRQALDNKENDQNFYDERKTRSLHPGTEPFLSMVIELKQGQPNPNFTLDGGFSCDAPDPEVDLMLVIDRSRSMQIPDEGEEANPSETLAEVRRAARSVVDHMLLPPQWVGLIRFNTQAEVLAPLAPEAQTTQAQLDNGDLWFAQGNTDIAAGLGAAQAQLLQSGRQGAKKVVFLWTDGSYDHIADAADRAAAESRARTKAAELHAAGIEVFVFGVTAPGRSLNESLLMDLGSSRAHVYTSANWVSNAQLAFRRLPQWACPNPMLPGELPIQCDAGMRGIVDLGTGAGGNRQAGPNGEDSRWKVLPPAPSIGRPASIVDPPAAGWTVLPASQWVGPDPQGNGTAGKYDYLTQFDLPGFVDDLRLSINMHSDDEIVAIKVNGQAVDNLASGAGGPSGEPRTLTMVQREKFNFGAKNELRITVLNDGATTGFDATGALQYCAPITADQVVPAQLGDTPKILAIHANGIGSTAQEPTTGFPVRLLADVFVPSNVRLTSCAYSGDGIQLQSLPGQIFGTGSGIRQDCNARFDLMRGAGPHPLTYGQKSTTLTIRYVNDITGAVGEIQRTGTYKAFFEKDGHDASKASPPNWFMYWRDDGAVPGLKHPAVLYGGTLGTRQGQFDDMTMTVTIFDVAATGDPYGFFRKQRGSCPGVDVPTEPDPLDNLAQVVAHELKHWEFDKNWEPGGIWRTADPTNPDLSNPLFWRDTDDPDHPNKKDGPNQNTKYDDIPDKVERESGLDPTNAFSCGPGKNDNEILAYRAKLNVHGVPSRDWANPGSQTQNGQQQGSGNPLLGTRGPSDRDPGAGIARCLFQPWTCGGSGPFGMLARMVAGDTSKPAERHTTDGLQADLRTGALTGDYAHQLVDLDGDTLVDRLDFNIGIDSDGGEYAVWARIMPANGAPIFVSAGDLVLQPGPQTIALPIDGRRLSALRFDAAYHIDEIHLSIPDPEGMEPFVLDAASDAYATPILQASQFEPTDVQVLGQHTDAGIDADADGVFEALKVGIGLTAHVAGTYTVSGILDTGSDKVMATTPVTLTTGTHLVGLSFPAGGIFRTRDDGAYRLESVRIENADHAVVDTLAPDYTTATYHHRQFAHAAVDLDLSNATDTAFRADPDADGDEVLEVAFGLNGLEQAVGYHIEAQLRDDQYAPVARGGAYVTAAAAQSGTIRVAFAGSHIRSHGADGPYTVSLTLFDGAGNVVDALPVAHVTAPYAADDFVAPPFEILGVAGEQPVDTDHDAVPDALTVAVMVMPHVTGDLTLMAGLDDPRHRTVALGTGAMTVTAGTVAMVPLSFDGAQIARYGASQPLTMRGLSGSMVSQPAQTVRREQPHPVAYDISQLGPLNTVGGGTPSGGVTAPGATPTAGVIAPTPTAGGPNVP